MKTIDNSKILENFVRKYNILDLFESDIRPYLKLYYYRKNDYIVQYGDEMDTLLFQVSGKAKVYIPTENGKSLLLCFYEPFKTFGDLELIGESLATSNVQVVKDTYCIGISLKILREKFFDDSKFLRYICNSLAQKLKQSSNNNSINLLYPVENRLASYIKATAETLENGEISVFKENLTETSELLGTSYRHLLRTLNNFCDKKILVKEKNYYRIIDMKKMDELSLDLYFFRTV